MPTCAGLVLSLLAILLIAQALPAHSNEPLASGVSGLHNCSVANSDFEADLKRLSETIRESSDIPPDVLRKHFAGCTIENARELLVKSGFAAEELGQEFDDGAPKSIVPRSMMAEKTIRPIGLFGSLNCRIILRTDKSNELSFQGFFYFDGP